MNPFKTLGDIVNRIRKPGTIAGIKEIRAYKKEIQKLYDEMGTLRDPDFIDGLIEYQGIANTAKDYVRINNYYKDYYKKIFTVIKDSYIASNQTKQLAINAEKDWKKTFEFVITYLYNKRREQNEEVTIYHSNAYQDGYDIPRNKKEDFNEGLKGVTLGGLSGAALAILVRSLGMTFRMNPAAMTGISMALGAAIGQFVQKHFFIDFTNYAKLKRYVESEPQSYEAILELMAKNASKFQQKDKIKYERILANLKRLKKNPPKGYDNYLDDDDDGFFDNDAVNSINQVALDKPDPDSYSYGDYPGSSFGSSRSSRRMNNRRRSKPFTPPRTPDFSMDDAQGLFDNGAEEANDALEDIFKGI